MKLAEHFYYVFHYKCLLLFPVVVNHLHLYTCFRLMEKGMFSLNSKIYQEQCVESTCYNDSQSQITDVL